MSKFEDQPVEVFIPSDINEDRDSAPLSQSPIIHKTSDSDEPELISLPTESITDAEISEEASLAEEIAINTSNLDGEEVLDSPGGSCSRASNHASPMRNLSSASGGLYVSAPGKLILFGEHAVVYGRTAIAGSIDLRTYVSLFTSADGRIYLSLPDLGVEKTWLLKDLLKAADRLAADHPVEEDQAPSLEVLVPIARKLSGSCEDQCGVQHLAILAFWYLLLGVAQRKSYLNRKQKNPVNGEGDGSTINSEQKRDLLAVKATVRFKLPSCVGLGSSGAYCVCIATSLLQTAGLISAPSVVADDDGSLTWDEKDLDMIRKWATAAESLIHGRASGLDAAVCTYAEIGMPIVGQPTQCFYLNGARPKYLGYRDYGYQSFTHLGYVGCHGGVASYNSRTGIEHLKNLPNLRVILVNSKVERNTSRMVQNVKQQMKTLPGIVESIFNGIDEISKESAKILHKQLEENGDLGEDTPINGGMTASSVGNSDHHSLQPNRTPSIRSQTLSSYVSGGKRGSSASAISAVSDKGEPDTFSRLNDLCRINNHLLNALGVGHPKIDQICTTLSRYGIHPKMTGAGGGGSVFAFLKPDTSQTLLDMIKSELNKLGYEVFQPYLGGAGVVEHQSRPDLFLTPSTASTPAPKHK